jgi:hypothetical protein
MFANPTVSPIALRNSRMKVACCSSPELTPLDFWSGVWIKSQVYKRKVDTRDEFFAGKLDVVTHVKKREDQLRRTTRELCTRVGKGMEVDGWIFDRIL